MMGMEKQDTKTPENIRQKSRTAENKEVNRMDAIAIFY